MGKHISQVERKWSRDIVSNLISDLGRPQVIADAVVCLASSRDGFINGMNLRVDGGMVPNIN